MWGGSPEPRSRSRYVHLPYLVTARTAVECRFFLQKSGRPAGQQSPHLYRARNLVEGTAANPEPVGLPAYGGCGFQRLVPAFDLARGHRMMWSPADMVHVVGVQPFGQVVGDV